MALGPASLDRSLSPRASGAGTGGTVGRSQDSLTQAGTGAAEAREAAWRQREEELKAQVQHLEKEKKEVEHRLDDDGRQFLEALVSLESEVSRLTKQNKQLDAERKEALERLNVQEAEFKLRLEEVERHRDHLLEVMTEEGQELQSRMEKLNGDNQKLSRDKESLTMDLAKAVARADVVVACTPPNSGKVLPDQEQQMRSLRNQNEELKDDLTNKDGEIVLLRSQIEIVQRKLKLTDMENGMLKSELSVYRQGSSGGPT
jgi:chromosome segregation ATPase